MFLFFCFWGFLLLGLGGVFACGLLMWRMGRGKGRQSLQTAGAGIVVGLGLLLMCTGAGALVGWYSNSRPANVYESEFGVPPARDVHGLQTYTDGIGDSACTYIHFTASGRTVRQLAKALALRKAEPMELSSISSDSAAPEWWHPHTSPGQWGFVKYGQVTSFSSETRFLLFDPKSGATYYYFVGVD